MNGHPREIRKYVTLQGNCPFDSWFEKLNTQTQVRIDVPLDRVRLGHFGDAEPVGQGVYELRFHFGPGYRVYYGLDGREVVLLLLGGDKKSQKRDIKKAQQFWKDYQSERNI